MPWHWWGQVGPWGWWWIFPVAFLLCLVIMIVMMASFCRHMMGSGHRPAWRKIDDEALAILRRRFAGGEISEEEFVSKRHLLMREHERGND